jgi:membrane-associated phospholipid phosphatase
MSMTVVIVLGVLTLLMLALEASGFRTTLRLSFKGDVKRETAFLAQYGQSVATPLAGWFVWIGTGDWKPAAAVVLTVLVASIACMVLKRLLGRMRPERPNAGRFTGPSLRHDNARESFPSSHSACAWALSVPLAIIWPEAMVIFYTLAWITAGLRYVLDAHYPSDVLAGVLLGYSIGHLIYEPILAALNR